MLRELVVITGMSGSGKSVAVKVLEDAGFFCVDNLPVVMLPQFLGLLEERIVRVAVVIDVRQPSFFENEHDIVEALRMHHNYRPMILYLDCDDQTLARRFAESRRPHPLSEGSIHEALRKERELLAPFRGAADLLVDTSKLAPHDLRQQLREAFSPTPDKPPLRVNIVSFGFKHGAPLDAHLILDMRFLPNPYWYQRLRPLTGKDESVAQFLGELEEFQGFWALLQPFFLFLLEQHQRRDRPFLTIAIGCTGGQHRSVYTAERLQAWLQGEQFRTMLIHRDLPRYVTPED